MKLFTNRSGLAIGEGDRVRDHFGSEYFIHSINSAGIALIYNAAIVVARPVSHLALVESRAPDSNVFPWVKQ
jgi:hypothetical protein